MVVVGEAEKTEKITINLGLVDLGQVEGGFVQGAGWLGGTYVAYGLGNFVWAGRNGEPDTRTGVLTLTVDGRRTTGARWTPLRVQGDGVPRPPARAQAERMRAQWDAARQCTDLSSAPGPAEPV